MRGLGERYSATMLNNAMIPTTEPEKRVIPLDLFPAALIDTIKILKTYTPDLPGEFSGGLVQMNTVEFPSTKVFTVSTNFGFNTRTTFDRFATHSGGDRDFFALQASPFFHLWACAGVDEILSALHERLVVGSLP